MTINDFLRTVTIADYDKNDRTIVECLNSEVTVENVERLVEAVQHAKLQYQKERNR